MKPTPTLLTEDPPLPQTVEACHAVMREWWVLMREMRARLLLLEEPVKLNSRTSSKPPCSDGLGRGSCSSKPKSGRKVGPQPGHKGSFWARLPSDQVGQLSVVCRPEPPCALCHGDGVAHADEDKDLQDGVACSSGQALAEPGQSNTETSVGRVGRVKSERYLAPPPDRARLAKHATQLPQV